MKKWLIYLLTIYICYSCNSTSHEQSNLNSIQHEGFISRIHTTDLKTDWYRLIGGIDLKKYNQDIGNIKWEKEYFQQTQNETYNYPSIEVLDTVNWIYLSLTIAPNELNINDYQFCVGLGVHLNPIDKNKEIGRKVHLYLTNTKDLKEIEKVIKPFFNRNHDKLKENINSYNYLAEIDDYYLNILQ